MSSQNQERRDSKRQNSVRITPDKYLDFVSAVALFIVSNIVFFLMSSSRYLLKNDSVVNSIPDVELWKKMNIPSHAQANYYCTDDCESRTSFVVVLANELNNIEIRSDYTPVE